MAISAMATGFAQRTSDGTIYLVVYATRPEGRLCAEVLTPYETTIPLELHEVGAGDWTVDVNGITKTLSLPSALLVTPPPANSPAGPTREVISGKAAVDSLEIGETSAVSATLIVRGTLPDGCTQIADHVQAVQGNTLRIELYTARPADQICTQALVPFEERIALDLAGLERGRYTVEVNGVRTALVIP